MGWFSKKSQSLPVDELSESQVKKVLKTGKAAVIDYKTLKKMNKQEQRAVLGEKSFKALEAAARETRDKRFSQLERDMKLGRDPHALTRMKSEDPRRYQKLLDDEARRRGLI